MSAPCPGLEDIEAARRRLEGLVSVTPCRYSETLSGLTGARVHVKLENLQITGSFNVLHIAHDRISARTRMGESEVVLTLETAGPEQIDAVKRRLAGAGYAAMEER